ncbi:YIP1 family protein [Natronomonas salina]|uniref:YIP1 family protein n=1 Tax=Natronomonas salina TaxID=1710540 RepID=UPI0015B5A886|nr:YIP1 family protein [Natronomonas salina]QLD90191.1 YIP1 family protein [Natronomonas salina]
MRLPAPLAALLTPKRFFAESEHRRDAWNALVVVSVIALIATASYGGMGLLFASSLDATVTVDNPERPPEWACETPTLEMNEEDCQRPAEIERDAGDLLLEMWVQYIPHVFLGTYAAWLLVGSLLFGMGRLMGAGVRWSDTLVVWGWAMLVDLLQAFVALGFVAWLTAGRTVTAETEAELLAEVEAMAAAVPEFNPLPLLVGAWQIVVVGYGLSETQDISVVHAALAAAAVLLPVSLFAAL